MNFKYLFLSLLSYFFLIFNSYACHDTGDSNCTPKKTEKTSSLHGHDHTNSFEKESFEEDDNPGVLNNKPYEKTIVNNGNSLKNINKNRSLEKIIKIINTEINEIKSGTLTNFSKNNYSDRLFDTIESIKFIFKNDNSISNSEKNNILSNINDLMNKYFFSLEKQMITKYDFGYFLDDLTIAFNNVFRETNERISENVSNKNLYSIQIDQRVIELNYIDKLYVLLNQPKKFYANNVKRDQIISKYSKLSQELKIREKKLKFYNKINKDFFNANNNYYLNKITLDKINLQKQIENLDYLSKVFDIIGEK